MTISALLHFPDVCRLCLQQKPAPEMVSLVSTLPEFDAQLWDLMKEFCAPVQPVNQELTSHLPSAMCEQCQQQFLTAFKLKRKVEFIQEFQIALAEMKHNDDPEPLRLLFLNHYDYMSSQLRALNLIDNEHELCWDDLVVSSKRNEDGDEQVNEQQMVDNLEIVTDDETDEKDSRVLHVEFLQDNSSSEGSSERSESTDHVEIEYLDVEPAVSDDEMIVEKSESCMEETFPTVEIIDKDSFAHHEKQHQELEAQTEWKCDIADCGERFGEKDLLVQHKKEVHHCWMCPICGFVLKNKYSLDVHIRRHLGKRNFACEYCPSMFYTAQEHKLHLGLVHVASETVKCDVCGLDFKNATCLKRHLKSHSDVRNYKCPHCDKAFKTNMHLHRHKETIHAKVRFKCGHCDMTYGRRDKLRMHIERVHNIQMYFLCNICLKSFSTEEQRQEHMYLHENPKPLECGTCLAAFLASDELDQHLCISYRENYVCCGRDFKFHTFYNKHMFLVHGEKTNARVKPADNKLIANIRAERKQEERCVKCGKVFQTRKHKNAHKLLCSGKQQHQDQPITATRDDGAVEFCITNQPRRKRQRQYQKITKTADTGINDDSVVEFIASPDD